MLHSLPPVLALLAGLAIGAAGCATTGAPLPEMVTDRPDFTESASTVPRGHVQIEAGYTFTRDADEGVYTSHTYPEVLARIGVADRLELRVGQSLVTTGSPGPAAGGRAQSTGAEDVYLGAKVHLADQRGGRPAMVLIGQATLPTGAASLSAGRALPGLNWIYAWDLLPNLASLTASTQGNLAVDAAGEDYLELTQSVSVGYSLSDRVGAYTEWFASFPAARRAGVAAAHSVDGGFTVKIGPRVQWDVRVGAGLTAGAEGFFAGSGVSVRY